MIIKFEDTEMTNIIFRDGIKTLNRSATISFDIKTIHWVKLKALNADRQHSVVQFEKIDIAVVLQSGVATIQSCNAHRMLEQTDTTSVCRRS